MSTSKARSRAEAAGAGGTHRAAQGSKLFITIARERARYQCPMLSEFKAVQRVECAWCTTKLGIAPCPPDRTRETRYVCCPSCARRVRVHPRAPWWMIGSADPSHKRERESPHWMGFRALPRARHEDDPRNPGRRQPHPRRRR